MPELMTLSLSTAGSSIVRSNPKSSISSRENMPGAVQTKNILTYISCILFQRNTSNYNSRKKVPQTKAEIVYNAVSDGVKIMKPAWYTC